MPFIPSAALLSDANSSPCINVKDPPYTARGDGVTDDTAAIQAALTAAGVSSQTRTVCLPPGTYSTGILSVPAGVTLTGSRAATLKLKAAVNNNLLTLGDGAVVDGITIDGNRVNQTISGAGVAATGVGCMVLDCAIAHAYTYGVLSANVDGVVIEGNEVSDTRFQGIFVEASSVAIQRIRIIGNTVDRSAEGVGISGTGITLKGTGTYNVTRSEIEGNIVSMPTGAVGAGAICIEPYGGVKRTRINNNDTSGGSMGISMDSCERCTCTGNTVYNPLSNGIELASSRNCTVSDNAIDGNSTTANGIQASNTTPDVNTLSGNNIRGCVTRGIIVANGDNTSISGNTISQISSYAMEIISTECFTITGNSLFGNGTATKGIVLNASGYGTVSGNQIFNFTENGFLLYCHSAYTMTYLTVNDNMLVTVNAPLASDLASGGALGDRIQARGNTYLAAGYKLDYLDFLNVIVEAWNSGSPETVVFANKGSIFHRSDGAGATCFYVKETDGANTGWVAK